MKMLVKQNQSPGILCRDQRKVSHGTSDGKQDLDASPMACSNVIAQPPAATISAGVAMSGQIQFRSLAISKNNEESNIDNSIIAGRAGISQAALILVLTPIDRHRVCISTGQDGGEEEKIEERSGIQLCCMDELV